MSLHAKKKPFPVKGLLAAICSVLGVCVIVAAILLVNNGVLDVFSGFFETADSETPSAVSGEVSPSSDDPFFGVDMSAPESSQPPLAWGPIEPSGNFSRPEVMRGAWLTPGVDYLLKDGDTGNTVKGQIDAALATMKEWEFNTVLLPLWKGEKTLYSSERYEQHELVDGDGLPFDPIQYILTAAREAGMYVYGIFDCRVGDKETGLDPTVTADREEICAAAQEVADRYTFDGWLVENYSYALGDGGSWAAYMEQAPGIGFDQFTTDCLKAMVYEVSQTFRAANRDYYVGLLSNAVWAHKHIDERGSNTNYIYEDMTDGHADTLDWVQSKLFDFVLVKDSNSTSHSTANFNNILDWWSGVCGEMGLPLYVAHFSDRVGGQGSGWNKNDQLARQYLACLDDTNWKGSVFTSLAALKKNPQSTNMLRKAMDGTYMSDYISDTLLVNQPGKTTYTTNESKATFTGSSNPNFPLTLNGKGVELSKNGYFSFSQELAIGLNTFTFESNGVTKTYKITYEPIVLKSVTPDKDVSLEGGTKIVFGAVAHKDSTVYAMINGTKVSMSLSEGQTDEGGDESESDYCQYVGTYTLPDGIVGKAQKLGKVKIYATYKTVSKSMEGGAITVQALPVTGGVDTPLPSVVGNLPLLSPSSGGEKLAQGDVVVITATYAETFRGTTTDDFSRPVNAYLPLGTTDRYVSEVYDSASKRTYYLLGSNRRVYTSSASIYKADDFTANTLTVKDFKVENTYTRLSLKADWRIPYNVQLAPQFYRDPDNPSGQKYDITTNRADLDEDAFTAEYLDITFYYTPQAGTPPNFAGSPIIKSAEWIKGEGNTTILRLHLKQKGGFYGYSVVWDKDGVLHFAFKHPNGTSSSSGEQKLSGVSIVLDPGHGGTSGTATPIGMNEKTLTLLYANLMKEKLEGLGAKVTMARTTADQNPTLAQRANLARSNGTDLFVSIHMNAGGGQGASYHYFNEYSYLPAQRMYAYARQVENSYSLGTRYQPVTFSPFEVTRLHDTPSVLVECGFYDQKDNYDLLINPVYQDKFTSALVDGIVDYFDRLPTVIRTMTAATSEQTARSETA